MSGFAELDKVQAIFTTNSTGCGMAQANLSDCSFNFTGSEEPFILYNGAEYTIESEWAINQLCKLIGITKKFYDRNPDKLSEEIFDIHIERMNEKSTEVNILFKEEGPRKVIRGIVPRDYFPLTNVELLSLISEHLVPDNVDSVYFIEGSNIFSPKTLYGVLTNDTIDLNGEVYNYGILSFSSEIGGSDLIISPFYINKETNHFFPLLVNGRDFGKISYLDPPNGTMIPQIREKLADIQDIKETVVDALKDTMVKSSEYKEMVEICDDWATRRGFSVSLAGKVKKNLTALVDTEDDAGNPIIFETMGDLVGLVMETAPNSKFESFYKVTKFLSERLGFNYKIKKK